MDRKVKIALCLSGQPRNTMAAFPYIYESFLLPHTEYQVDTYIHSWNGFRALDLYSPKRYLIEHINDLKYFDKVANQLNITSKEVNNFLEPFKRFTGNIHPLKNTILMYSSINKCFNLIKEEYDYYIRCRLDLIFEKKIDLLQILSYLYFNPNIDILISPKQNQFKNNIVDDQLAFGNKKSMVPYFNLINNLNDLINQTNSIHPEILLASHLNNNKVNYMPYNFTHKIIHNSVIESTLKNFKNE
jgi:hypothetical protein